MAYEQQQINNNWIEDIPHQMVLGIFMRMRTQGEQIFSSVEIDGEEITLRYNMSNARIMSLGINSNEMVFNTAEYPSLIDLNSAVMEQLRAAGIVEPVSGDPVVGTMGIAA